MDEERFVVAARNSKREEVRAEREMRLLRARCSVELGKVAFGSATQCLANGKVGSQVIAEDRSQLSGRRTVAEVRRCIWGPATERRREYTDLVSDFRE